MISPSGTVPEQGLDWFLVATEACGGGTPDLGYVMEVWGYIRGVGVENKSGESTRGPQGRRARPRGVGAPSTLVVASGLLWCISGTSWASFGPKTIVIEFQVNWTPFDIPFLQNSKTRKKQKLTLGSRLIG